MYRFHGEVVAQIQALSGPERTARQDALRKKLELLAGQLRAEKDLTKALARACAELAAEKAALSEQLEDDRLRFELRMESLQKKVRGAKSVGLVRAT
jgi:hypothetical protein